MTSMERARRWIDERDLGRATLESDVASLAMQFDTVREEAAVEQWGKDQSNHHTPGTVTCQPCIRLYQVYAAARALDPLRTLDEQGEAWSRLSAAFHAVESPTAAEPLRPSPKETIEP